MIPILITASFGLLACQLSAQSPNSSVTVHGARIAIARAGPATSPTVVFESGLGEDASTWRDIQPVVAARTSTLAYDRPGLGKSEPSGRPRDALTMARDLHGVLEASRVPKPYVLVGHSLGAWIVQAFARHYPDLVAGLVLVDPAYQESRLRAVASDSAWGARASTLARYSSAISPAQQRERDALETSGLHGMSSFPRRGIPVVLLSGTKINASFPLSVEERRVKLSSHEEWLRRVPGARQVVVPDGRHYLQSETPAQVLAAIEEVLAKHAARRGARER